MAWVFEAGKAVIGWIGGGSAAAAGANASLGAILAKTVTTLAVSYGLQKLSLKSYDGVSAMRGRTQNVRAAVQPRIFLYGQCRQGGQIIDVGSSGSDNEYWWRIIVHAGHEVEEIGDLYVDGELVPLSAFGTPNSGNKYYDHLKVWSHLGSDAQTVDTNLLAAFPGVWTTDHRLRGCAYTVYRMKWDQESKVYPNGIPTFTHVIKGKKVYDPRSVSTVWSDNWALCVADYIKEVYRKGNGDFDTAAWTAAANVSDELVTLEDLSTEARYAIDGTIPMDEDPRGVIQRLRDAGAGFVEELGGKWVIHAGAYRASNQTFDEDDFVSGIQVNTKDSIFDGANRVRGTFANRDANFSPMEFPPVENAGYLAEDGGIERWADLTLTFTTSGARAQRLAKIALERARQGITVKVSTTVEALKSRAGDTVALDFAKYGWSGKLFLIERLKPVLVGGGPDEAPAPAVELELRETASGVWDWANGEETAIDLAPNTSWPDPWTVEAPVWANLESGADQLIIGKDGTVQSRILAEWSFSGDAFVDHFEVQYRSWEAELSMWGWIPLNMKVPANVRQIWLAENVYDGYDYEFRIRAVNGLGMASDWVISDEETVVGKSAPPGAPSSLDKTDHTSPDLVELEWSNPSDIDLRGVEIWRRLGTNTFDEQYSSKIAETRAERFVVADEDILPAGIPYYFARAIDTSGNTSAAVKFYEDPPV